MSATYVEHLGFALGELTDTVEDAVALERTLSTAPVLRQAGFEVHHRCGPEASAFDLAVRAVESTRAPLGEFAEEVGAIVYATCLPECGNVGSRERFEETRDVKHVMDFPASRLQAHFGFERAQVFGLAQQACTGMLGSLRLASLLLRGEPELRRVLCVTADRFPEGALYEQAYNLISDGAAACFVSRDPSPATSSFEIQACHQITNGSMAGASDDETVGSYFSYTHRLVQETLGKAGIAARDVDWIVPQNTNVKAWQILARLLGVDYARVSFASIGDVGHVISADNLINLRRLDESGALRSGQRALLVMAGFGLNWQAALLRKS